MAWRLECGSSQALSLTGRQPVLVVIETLAAQMPGDQGGLPLRPGLPCSLVARFQGCVLKERGRQKLYRRLGPSLKSHTRSLSSHSVCHGRCSETGSRLRLVMEWQGSEEDGDQECCCSHLAKLCGITYAVTGKSEISWILALLFTRLACLWASNFISFCILCSPYPELQLPLFLFYHWTVSFLGVASTSRCLVLFCFV